ncbi:MAG: ribosome-associated translation inhibitor RaiA [Alphaproteobacteria bacterium]|nr:ribosome-associated translation inhibitor RaiA [Alphaproteobacteria bacterium]
MRITVTGKHIDVGDSLRQHVRTALESQVGKYFDNALESHVTVSLEGIQFRSDLSVHVGRGILAQGHAAAASAYGSFDLALEKVAKQLRRGKRRLRDHHKDAGRVLASDT